MVLGLVGNNKGVALGTRRGLTTKPCQGATNPFIPTHTLVNRDPRTSKPRTKRGGHLGELYRPFRARGCFKFLSPGRCPGLVCYSPFGASVVCGARFRRMDHFLLIWAALTPALSLSGAREKSWGSFA